MTSEGLGEMFEGDSADTCARKFPLMLMGDERTVQRAQTVSEDPHRRERNLYPLLRPQKTKDIYLTKIFLARRSLIDMAQLDSNEVPNCI